MLLIAATPIGNPEDASPRLRRWLREADVVAAEDTRRLRRLCADLAVEPLGRLLAHHEHNEQSLLPQLLDVLRADGSVLLVSDAGMPTVSDPGYRLVRAAREAGLAVTVVPGPSAVVTALAAAGLPTDRFTFEGFLPRRAADRGAALAALAEEARTMVFFEAPHRLAESLADMAGVLGGDREAAVCRELTKTYEEVVRGDLAELADWAGRGNPLGEITIVVRGAGKRRVATGPELVAEVESLAAQGQRLRSAVASVAERTGARRNDLYDAVLAERRRGGVS